MNNYQEAWEKILDHDDKVWGQWTPPVRRILLENEKNGNLETEVKLIQELVDRATPKKVIKWLSNGSMACCPWCHGAEYAEQRPNYCHYCGQALDWSSEQIAKGETK